MTTYFISHETVIHPETRERLVYENEVLTVAEFEQMASKYGMDNIEGRIVMAESLEAAYSILEGIMV